MSGRLLRYYDSIGLFSPSYTDPVTGYRYYKAGQLAQLNRILALKDLGLSLEQVGRMIDEQITAEEVRGMLTLKRAELERTLSDGIARLRHIESRLRQIDEQGSLRDYDFRPHAQSHRHCDRERARIRERASDSVRSATGLG